MNQHHKLAEFACLLTFVISLPTQSAIAGEVDSGDKNNGMFNVRDFGAAGDGNTLDSPAIQAAVDACASSGGGTVLLSPGVYLSGTIILKSNVALHIRAGATLLGSPNIRDYPEIDVAIPSYNDSFLKHSLIFAEGQQNIAITGRGTIDGQGAKFKITTKKKPERYRNRPFGLRIVNCKNVLVENLTLRNSAMWMQQYFACDGVVIRGLKVYNHSNKNNDMIDIDSSRNVIMSDCFGDSDDDAITLKSTTGRITENVTITNCVVSSHVNAIKMGTESHGGFRNITISNIVVRPSASPTHIYGTPNGIGGITLGMVDGGILEGVVISNIRIDGAATPIFLRLGDRGRTYHQGQEKPPVGVFRNVTISEVLATGASDNGCSITGLPGHPIAGISLNNIRITFAGGGTREDAARQVPENEDGYPGSRIFGKLPAYGFFIRHAQDVSLNNVSVAFEREDARPALICDDVAGLDVVGFKAQGTTASDASIRLINTSDVLIRASRIQNKVNTFISVEGRASENISLFGNEFSKASAGVRIADQVPQNAVRSTGNFHE